MPRQELRKKLNSYVTDFSEEKAFIPRFLSLLDYPNCLDRSLLFGHVTASAWVTNPELNRVLLIHHAKLDRWLQPGGHTDGNGNVIAVATKELTEETGLKAFRLVSPQIFDLDIHTIPERKNVPQHDHYDFRFHFIAEVESEVVRNNESLALKWVPTNAVLELVNNEQSFVRMLGKSKPHGQFIEQ